MRWRLCQLKTPNEKDVQEWDDDSQHQQTHILPSKYQISARSIVVAYHRRSHQKRISQFAGALCIIEMVVEVRTKNLMKEDAHHLSFGFLLSDT
jgi:mitochondrial fission protein ELM1